MAEEAHSIEITRIFDAPPEVVFGAWLDPDLMRGWMLRGKCLEVEVEPREGGSYRLTAEMPYGPAVAFGTFREIRAPERLVLTFSWEQIPIGETVITIDCRPHPEATEMHFRQELFPDEGTASIHEAAWPLDFDLLATALTGGRPRE